MIVGHPGTDPQPGVVNLRRIGNPPPSGLAQGIGRRINNPPQVYNPRLRVRARMPHKQILT